MASDIKKQIVASLKKELDASKNFVVVGFSSTTHQDLEELRAGLRAAGSRMTVVKNSLLKVAVKQLGLTQVLENPDLIGSSAIITLPEDWGVALSAFQKFAKSHDTVGFKVGVIETITYGKDDLTKLATLPSKEELVVKIILSLRSSQTRVARALTYNIGQLINVVNQASKKE
ncbi:50S ribosomal protein L10 [Candidatus Roizmanbacteria bacterium RIFCSPHIGHO2_02_FULL_40_13b]|uniref:Large ribosomal subunit protein uL10 n=1 Tax=Candidatus Roizmanbacteria bacterium RIFCSPHIGHO2_01_FULL_39_24 TaxID=1802032 RepID=A0A1F7GET6_9BACT|nr:MAG: 50S ribosomal protein L10 [Candidatus Roizmanbacteria bacterium RIFCSPHIGHO2_01_FULL_39_24]OGK27888.1 MAG: 50S ribosomal protein L10 [Candidatus Roizmanbacteria bacterium RIFCSPHIGHO2_02_FULL_40_13b]OGK49812.1 MAG: 50S ribosomal protein L10 [Candidatus Roizmanbacteria bacterium RIFCSPLOWO2_01_FULL_40_32]OGK57258.1 MAG: 50S ribosomal protein L10 [Candidatus Roizmanbacteria bacterium RIFCSPLOWO2_02_FULL_39_8]